MDWGNLKADYKRLGSYTAVAAEYGVSKGYVAQEAKKQGINPKPEGRSLAIDWSGLPDLYDGGMTLEQLAEHYGCSVHAVQNAMRRYGVTARPKGSPVGYEWTDERRAAHRAAVNTPEWRAKSRENLLKRLPSMRGASANSPLEKLLQAALMKSGISFSTQRVLLGRYCVDILITQKPVVIEADGATHSLPKRKAQDAIRDAALTAAGYRVFRFSGTRINRDALGCIVEVIAEAGLSPDAEPVADIRTGMTGPENPNWTGGPQGVTCASCGRETTRPKGRTAVKRTFCNSECYGAWMRAHPEESNRKLKADWSELPALYAAGKPMAELMQRYNCSRNTIHRQLRRMDVPMRRRSPGDVR
jgi:very-short-patch-repair endonuclease